MPKTILQKVDACMHRYQLLAMTWCCAFAVSAIYYHQPLLPQMAGTFGVSLGNGSWIATITQLGYALGLLLFVPLADRIEPRTLAARTISVNALALLACAFAPSFTWLLIGCAVVGMTAITAQIIIPTMVSASAPAAQGKVIGSLLGGLSAGLLLARMLSGYGGAEFGWHAIFAVAAALNGVMLFMVWRTLPVLHPQASVSYAGLLKSMVTMLREEPLIRLASASGFLMFSAFSALWASLASMLSQPPYHFNPAAIGAFGFVGLVGLFASKKIGMLVDRFGAERTIIYGCSLIALAYVFVALCGLSLVWLVVGMALMDVGNRAGLVANQSRIFATHPEARNRTNTIFMVSYFLGGAAGAALGGYSAHVDGWHGLAFVGIALTAIAGVMNWVAQASYGLKVLKG